MFRLLLVASLLALPLAAQQQPTAREMAFIYELNRARSDPQRYDTENSMGGLLNGVAAQPPLALNLNLVQSSRFHANEMAVNGYFAHTSAVNGDQPNKMVRDAGYPLVTSWPNNANYLESLAVIGTSGSSISYPPNDALKALLVDAGVNPPGHRIHLLAMDSFNQAFREVGTGYAEGDGWTGGINAAAYWAIHTGRRNVDPIWLTGVVYNDANTNGRYDEGEGLSGVTVSAVNGITKNTTSTTGGGWSIDVSAGNWNVTCSGGAFIGTATASVNMTSFNIEVDFESGDPQGEIAFGDQIPTPPGGGGGGGSGDGGGGCSTDSGSSLWLVLLLGAAVAGLARIGVNSRLHRIARSLHYVQDPESAVSARNTPWAASGVDMRTVALSVIVATACLLSGCTVFQDDIYKAQAGYYWSDDFSSVEQAIHDEFAERFGENAVFRADVEWKYNNWTVISEQRARGHDKYRTRVTAYPQLDADGMYSPIVIAKQEVYTGASASGRGGPTAMYSNMWTEAGRDTELEVELSNAIYNRIHAPAGAAKDNGAGGK
jgi:uncharacterized protein YkwD